MVKMAQIINPEVDTFLFPEDINDNNTEELLEDVDFHNVFAIKARMDFSYFA